MSRLSYCEIFPLPIHQTAPTFLNPRFTSHLYTMLQFNVSLLLLLDRRSASSPHSSSAIFPSSHFQIFLNVSLYSSFFGSQPVLSPSQLYSYISCIVASALVTIRSVSSKQKYNELAVYKVMMRRREYSCLMIKQNHTTQTPGQRETSASGNLTLKTFVNTKSISSDSNKYPEAIYCLLLLPQNAKHTFSC